MQRNTTQHDTENRANENTNIDADAVTALREHDDVEKVVTYDDHSRLDGVMVVIDWVTESTIENGTRMIHEKEYTGQLRRVSAFIDELDGVQRARGSKSGLARYTYHVEVVEE